MDNPESLSDEDWKELNRILVKVIPSLTGNSKEMESTPAQLIASSWSIAAYPRAKQWLISEGHSPEEAENMAVSKAIGLWSIYRYSIIRDDNIKITQLPFWQKEKFNPDGNWQNFEVATPLDAMVHMLFPAVNAYHRSLCRAEATGDMLRIVEAVRLYAAENGGKYPDKLDDITSVPIPPMDPFTGKPYNYRIENGTAIVEVELGYGTQRIVIRLR